MVLASQLVVGMTIVVNKKPHRVDHVVKVTAQKANPFVKVKLRELASQKISEKNFRPTQDVDEVSLEEHRFEYLYPEGGTYVFLDLGTLDTVAVPGVVIEQKVQYLREGVEVKGACFGVDVFSIELPQYLELMVSAINREEEPGRQGNHVATLETGAKIDVPPFVEVGDILKVDTRTEEFIQRV